MVRPRRLDDEALLERIAYAIGQRSTPAPWKLAEIAEDVGLSPAGILKRFGSRRDVLLALSHRWIAAIPTQVEGRASAEEELHRWTAARFARQNPAGVARGLTDLLDDLADEDLRGCLNEGWSKEIAYLESLLRQIAPRRLADPARGAHLLFDALNGAMFRQATQPDTSGLWTVVEDFLETWK